MIKKIFKINSMHCNSCAQKIESSLVNQEGVEKVDASYSNEEVIVEFDSDKISESSIKDNIKDAGYDIVEDNVEEKNEVVEDNLAGLDKEIIPKEVSKSRKSISDNLAWLIVIIGVLLIAYLLYTSLEGFNLSIPDIGDSSGIFLLFFVGILTGFHCVSMCGAFVVSYTTKNALKGHKSFKQHLVYGGAKLFSYTLIGGLFGFIGGIFAFSIGLRGTISILAGIFMIFYALSMMGIKFFRRFQFNPKFLTKLTYKFLKEAKGPFKAPLITGLLGGLFIACGPLQAMYLYATGSGSFFNGAISLFAFGLGTLPVMLGFASLATVISKNTTKKILKVSAIIVLILGIIMLNRGLTVLGSSYSYDAIKANIVGVNAGAVVLQDGFQEINMEVTASGWNPNSFVLKKGIPVKWNIDVKELTGCNNEIIVRDYNLDIKLKKGMNIVEFTPDKTGNVQWSCWMGMIPGSFVVTEDGSASAQEVESATPAAAGSCGMGAGGGSCGSPTCGASSGGSCGCGG